jgi:hypothetical protein
MPPPGQELVRNLFEYVIAYTQILRVPRLAMICVVEEANSRVGANSKLRKPRRYA